MPLKGRVAHPLRQPCAVVDHSKRAQRLDQRQLTAIKLANAFVALQKGREAAVLFLSMTPGEHPQVLNGRAHARIVQVHKMRAAHPLFVQGRPQNISRMAVPMESDLLVIKGKRFFNALERLLRELAPCLLVAWSNVKLVQ